MTIPVVTSVEDQLESALARIAELEAQKEAPRVEAVAEKAEETVKHWLHLGDGTVVESTGAVPTQVHKADGTVVPVTAAFVQQKVSA